MPLSLPPRPNLDQLKKQAKELLRAHHAGDKSVCCMLRQLHRFHGRDDAHVLSADLALAEAQLALALEYGFAGWADLKRHIEPDQHDPARLRREGSRTWLSGVLDEPVGSGRNRQLLGLRTLLHSLGVTASFDELMVYGGTAFCLSHPNSWHETTRLAVPTDFMLHVAGAFGYELQWHIAPFRSDMAEYEPLTQAAIAEIRHSIDIGIPVLAGGLTEQGCAAWSVVVGYDAQRPELAHVGLSDQMRWLGIRGIAFPCNLEEGFGGHWNAQVQIPSDGAYTHWRVNPFVTLRGSRVVDRMERTVSTLQLACELFHHAPKPPDGTDSVDYWFGQDAFEHAARDYETLSLSQLLDTSPREAACRMQMLRDQAAWLRDDRLAAAAFCRRAATEGSVDAALLAGAATGYERLSRVVRDALGDLPNATSEQLQQWYAVESNRTAAAKAMREAADCERYAIAAIEEALDKLDRRQPT